MMGFGLVVERLVCDAVLMLLRKIVMDCWCYDFGFYVCISRIRTALVREP